MLIIGGGLSGLALAGMLEACGEDYLLLEARSRFGGRIKTLHHKGAEFDLGPAWFWPGQPRIAALIERLGLEPFDQYARGDLVFENEQGQVQRGRGFSSMQGSWRLKGGLASLTDALAGSLPDHRKRLNARVTKLVRTKTGVTATLHNGKTIPAQTAVLSMPPRVAANIRFDPVLPDATVSSLQNIPTWMAGQGKAVAIYETPFWRENGLSGDAQSRFGPMVEIHDASPASGGPYALFGFIGVPPKARKDVQVLRHHIQNQLIRLFGPKAANPSEILIKDWAFDPFTATQADRAPLFSDPDYGLPPSLASLWDGLLHVSGTEAAPQFGGYLEGALEAAENTLQTLQLRQVEA